MRDSKGDTDVWIWQFLPFGFWIFYKFYKLFLALFANTVNFLETIVFFEGFLFRLFS